MDKKLFEINLHKFLANFLIALLVFAVISIYTPYFGFDWLVFGFRLEGYGFNLGLATDIFFNALAFFAEVIACAAIGSILIIGIQSLVEKLIETKKHFKICFIGIIIIFLGAMICNLYY